MASPSRNGLTPWRLTQVFGGEKAPNEEIPPEDIVSSIVFDSSGDFLAAGDSGGRVVLFERSDPGKYLKAEAEDKSPDSRPQRRGVKAEYRFHAEFQSHEAEFDCLKSIEVSEKINQIQFLPRFNAGHLLLTTNEKTIKLWKIHRRRAFRAATPPLDYPPEVYIPKCKGLEEVMNADTKIVFDNGHSYHINSLSISSDQETFISSDDLRIVLWPFSSSNDAFNIVDLKPENLDDLTMVITSASFNPKDCAQFAYATSKGTVHLCDLRSSALCDTCAKTFGIEEDKVETSYFSEIIKNISGMKYSQDGRFIVTRDFMSLRLWDLAMEREPVKTITIHGRYQHRLADFYENDSIFDKFECALNYNGTQMVTGSYSRRFGIYDVTSSDYLDMIAGRVPPTPLPVSEDVDFGHSVLHVALHPKQNILAATSMNNLFIFS